MIKDHSDSHMGCSFRLAARVILYAPSHRQDNTYHGLCYTSRGSLAGTRNSSIKVELTFSNKFEKINLTPNIFDIDHHVRMYNVKLTGHNDRHEIRLIRCQKHAQLIETMLFKISLVVAPLRDLKTNKQQKAHQTGMFVGLGVNHELYRKRQPNV